MTLSPVEREIGNLAEEISMMQLGYPKSELIVSLEAADIAECIRQKSQYPIGSSLWRH